MKKIYHGFVVKKTTLFQRDNLFGVSKSGTALLRAGISNIQIPENYLKNDDRQWNLKPLLSVISDKTLNYSTFTKINIICFECVIFY